MSEQLPPFTHAAEQALQQSEAEYAAAVRERATKLARTSNLDEVPASIVVQVIGILRDAPSSPRLFNAALVSSLTGVAVGALGAFAGSWLFDHIGSIFSAPIDWATLVGGAGAVTGLLSVVMSVYFYRLTRRTLADTFSAAETADFMAGWIELESEALLCLGQSRTLSGSRLARLLEERQVLTASQAETMRALAGIRNDIVHGDRVLSSAAASRALRQMRELKRVIAKALPAA
jgi:hypothetical protein